MSTPPVTRSLFSPQPMEKWDDANALQAKQFSDKLDFWGYCCKIIGTAGMIMAATKLGSIAFGAAVLIPTIPILAITGIALMCLGMYLHKVSAKHLEGLDIQAFAVQKLIEGFDQLPIYSSKDDLDAALKSNVKFMHNMALEAIEKAQAFKYLATVLYRPTKDIQPRFRISSKDLTMEQIQALLDKAYERGIILEFSQLIRYNLEGAQKALTCDSDVKNDYGENTLKNMHLGFDIALAYLEKRFQVPDLDVKKVNAQLDALGFKWESEEGTKVLKPNFYLEDNKTLVIRGNCSEIPNPIDAIKRLYRYVNYLKMPYTGIRFLKLKIEGHDQELFLLAREGRDWDTFSQHVSELTKGRLMRVNRIEIKEDYEQIWQSTSPHDVPLKDSAQDFNEDMKRVSELKKKAQPA